MLSSTQASIETRQPRVDPYLQRKGCLAARGKTWSCDAVVLLEYSLTLPSCTAMYGQFDEEPHDDWMEAGNGRSVADL